MHKYVYSIVSRHPVVIYNDVNYIYIRVSKWAKVSVIALAGLLATAAYPVAAKERPPEPIERPGECPIDAPLRVANIDSLRRFEGLIAHCPEAMMIESPAFHVNRPRSDTRIRDPRRDPANNPVQPVAPSSDTIIFANGQPVPKPDPVVSRPRGTMPDYVAIIPPAAAFAPSGPLSVTANSGFEGGNAQADVEAILALRPQTYATSFDEKIAAAARTHRVDPLLLHAVIKQESGYRQRAVSHAGARGLMQVMPATGRSLGVADPQSLFDADVNIAAGAKLLSALWQRFDGDVDLVLAAYNAGEGAVMKYGRKVPPYRETRDYVAKVKDNYRSLASESGIAVPF